ncbi:hypothetical protein IAU59_005346 [Kwoniella sp. CBS 9459]
MSPHPHPPLTPFGSALAGALGSVFANAVVYPLDTVKTRLQAEGFPDDEGEDEDEDAEDDGDDHEESDRAKASDVENAGNMLLEKQDLEAGAHPQAISSQPSSSKAESKAETKAKAKAKAGAVERYLLNKFKRWGMLMMLVRIISRDGIGGMFHGFGASMIGTFSQQFAYFFFHTLLRTTYIKRLSGPGSSTLPSGKSRVSPTPSVAPRVSLSTSSELLLGALAGALAQIFTIPVQVIATRQQLWRPPPSPRHRHQNQHQGQHLQYPQKQRVVARAPTLMETAQEIVSEKGLTGLWTGLKPGLVLTVNPAITYGAFERLKSLRLAQRGGAAGGSTGKLGVGESFWLGVGSKTLATIVTYPYIFAKVRLQAKPVIDPPTSEDQPTSTPIHQPGSDATITGTGILGSGAKGTEDQAGPSANASETKSTAAATSTSDSGSEAPIGVEGTPSYASVASAPPSFGSVVVPPRSVQDTPHSDSSRPALPNRKSSHHQHHPHHHYDDALTLLKAVYDEHGWRGWYQGLGAQITKAVLCQGILFVSKDQFESYAWLLMVFFSNIRKSVLPF